MVVGFGLLSIFLGLIIAIIMRLYGCGWWSLFGLWGGGFVIVALLSIIYTIRNHIAKKKINDN